MRYIKSDSTDASFYFALEEYLALRAGGAVMFWRTDPCVMLGRNQVAGAEVRLDEARARGARIVRRPSGGGTIYTDPGTLQVSLIFPFEKDLSIQQTVRERFAVQVMKALARLGISAVLEGRNDILVGGKKVSGFSQFMKNGYLCCHCSILYSADLDALEALLSPEGDKISTKAPRSIRSRVINLEEVLCVPDFFKEFESAFLDGLEYTEAGFDLTEVLRIQAEKYKNDAWTYAGAPKYTYRGGARFSGGRADVYLDVDKGIIRSCAIRGDFLGILPIRELEALVEGIPFDKTALEAVLRDIDVSMYLGGISKEEFLSLVGSPQTPRQAYENG